MLNYSRRPFAEKITCLKTGKQKYTGVNQAQKESPQDSDDSQKRGFLRCVDCHYPITSKNDRISINEMHRHVFANPHGYIYQIGCFAQAPGCVGVGRQSSEFSWFPGYTWQVSLCGQCLTLLGWTFRSRESLFFGLILEKLVVLQ